MHRISRRVAVTAALMLTAAALPPSVSAQALKEIGKTSTGDPVLLETASVKKADGIITAAVRARFAKPTKAPMGDLYASRTIFMFDCA